MRHLPFALIALMMGSPAFAENMAVVISNGEYEHAPAVPDADGAAALAALKAAGYKDVTGADLAAEPLRKVLGVFLDPATENGARVALLNGWFLTSGSDSWFMSTEADKPDRMSVTTQGVSLDMVADIMRTAEPGAVLLLGTAEGEMPHGTGLEPGLGAFKAPEGVTVLTGPAAVTTAAATALAKPGATVQSVLDANKGLTMLEGGNPGLVLVEAVATDNPAGAEAKSEPTVADRDLWADAAATNTAEAYQNYLTAYPTGLYSAAAAERLAKLGGGSGGSDRDAWAQAAAEDTAKAYEDYLAAYPEGKYADAAEKRRLELRLAEDATTAPAAAPAPAPAPQPVPQARAPEVQTPRRVAPAPQVQQPRPVASDAQIAESRIGLTRQQRINVQKRLQTLGYRTGGVDGVFGPSTRSALRGWQQRNGYAVTGYLTGAQMRALADEVSAINRSQASNREQQDRDYWRQTGARGGERNLRAYLNAYPNGIYADTARNRLYEMGAWSGQQQQQSGSRERQAWQRARNQNSVNAYENYLNNFPNGAHAREAIQRRNALIQNSNLGGLGGILNGGGGRGGNIGGIDAGTILQELIK